MKNNKNVLKVFVGLLVVGLVGNIIILKNDYSIINVIMSIIGIGIFCTCGMISIKNIKKSKIFDF